MSNPVISLKPENSARAVVISEVRAEMARKNINSSKLARMTNTKQQFWSRRLTGETAFDVDDFAVLASVLQVPMSKFMPDYIPGGDPVNANVARRGGAPTGDELPDLDSNQEPAGYPLAPVTPIGIRHSPAVLPLSERHAIITELRVHA